MMLIGDSWHLSYNPNQKLLRQVDPQKVNPRYVTWETKSPHRNTSETIVTPFLKWYPPKIHEFLATSSEVESSWIIGTWCFRNMNMVQTSSNIMNPPNIIKHHHEFSKHRATGSREAPHLSRRRQDGQASDAHLVDDPWGNREEFHCSWRCWILTGAFYVGNG